MEGQTLFKTPVLRGGRMVDKRLEGWVKYMGSLRAARYSFALVSLEL